MRKIEQSMVDAIRQNKGFSGGNTQVFLSLNGFRVKLHGNLIFEKDGDTIRFTLAGWPTPTTRSRIYAVLSMFTQNQLYQQAGKQFFGGRQISPDEWVTV